MRIPIAVGKGFDFESIWQGDLFIPQIIHPSLKVTTNILNPFYTMVYLSNVAPSCRVSTRKVWVVFRIFGLAFFYLRFVSMQENSSNTVVQFIAKC